MWCVGIDWADAHHDVAVVDEQGTRHGAIHVMHSAAGMEELTAWLHPQAARAAQAACGCPCSGRS